MTLDGHHKCPKSPDALPGWPGVNGNESVSILLIVGGVFLLGVLTDAVCRRIHIPRVSILLLIGLALGPLGFGLLAPSGPHRWLSGAADIALVLVGFLLGSHFTIRTIRRHGQAVMWYSVSVVVATVAIVGGGLLLLGAPLAVALLLAGIATATDPTAIVDVINETGTEGPFSQTLLGIVAIDDALGLMAFSILLAVTHSLGGGSGWSHFLVGAWEIGGALVIGGLIGLAMSRTLTLAKTKTGRCTERREMVLMETLGFIFVCGGLAHYLQVSFLLSAMTLGMVTVNLIPRECVGMVQAIEDIVWPFLTLFFVFAGASLQPESLPHIGLLGIGYVLFRALGRVVGGWAGGHAAGSDPLTRRWMGTALMPQAGIALGMALISVRNFPEFTDIILPIVIGSTVLFQLVGPLLTRTALSRTWKPGESP